MDKRKLSLYFLKIQSQNESHTIHTYCKVKIQKYKIINKIFNVCPKKGREKEKLQEIDFSPGLTKGTLFWFNNFV